MLGFLAGVPGRLKTITTRLSATWAAQLDTLATRLSATWAAKLDTLASNFTSTVASRIDVAVSTRATDATPILAVPIASGLVGGNPATLQGYPLFGGHSHMTTNSTTYVDAVNYTGQGVVEFAAALTPGANPASIRITIDGVVVSEQSTTNAAYNIVCPVGLIGSQYLATLGAVPFKSSLLIQVKSGNAATTVYCYFKYRKTA